MNDFEAEVDNKPFIARLQLISANSGFKMDGYWVWCGSMIKMGNTYHMFASCWPKKNKFPDDYYAESEIVRATFSSPMGSYFFQNVVVLLANKVKSKQFYDPLRELLLDKHNQRLIDFLYLQKKTLPIHPLPTRANKISFDCVDKNFRYSLLIDLQNASRNHKIKETNLFKLLPYTAGA